MKNKRTLVISAVAVLAVILSVTAFLAFTRPAKSAQLIPVTGHIRYGGSPFDQIARQNQAANAGGTSKMKSPGDEYIQGQQVQAANTGGISKMKSPGDEYIPTQQGRWISNQEYMQTRSK